MCSVGLVTQRDSYLLNEARGLGIPTFDAEFFRSRVDVRVPIRLRRVVREFEPQAVHAHGGRAAFFYALAAARPPLVYTVHGYHFLHKSPFARRLALSAERLACRRARELILVSEYDARVAKAHGILRGPTRGTVIRNGIPLPKIAAPQREMLAHVGFIGRLEYQKDPLLFLDVMEQLPGYTAIMLGGGAMEDEVRAELQRRNLPNVRMLGTLAHPETLELLSSLGTVIMTSRWEGMPILPLEAMWAGVPVVATNVGALGEVIEDGKSGLLVDSRSPDDLAQAVRRVTGDPALRKRIVENGRHRVRELFSEERMLSELLKVYRRVIET